MKNGTREGKWNERMGDGRGAIVCKRTGRNWNKLEVQTFINMGNV